MSTFAPTHTIVVTYSDRVDTIHVSLCETDYGPAYTEPEWESDSRADWESDGYGRWTFQGRPGPNGAKAVQVHIK